MSEAKRTVGNAEKSSGRSTNKVTVKIRMAKENEAARPMSRTHAGIGRIIMTMTAIKAIVSTTVGLKTLRIREIQRMGLRCAPKTTMNFGT